MIQETASCLVGACGPAGDAAVGQLYTIMDCPRIAHRRNMKPLAGWHRQRIGFHSSRSDVLEAAKAVVFTAMLAPPQRSGARCPQRKACAARFAAQDNDCSPPAKPTGGWRRLYSFNIPKMWDDDGGTSSATARRNAVAPARWRRDRAPAGSGLAQSALREKIPMSQGMVSASKPESRPLSGKGSCMRCLPRPRTRHQAAQHGTQHCRAHNLVARQKKRMRLAR